jgi:UDP-N-acetyl-D-mannosaminuronate dehydrogenase
MKVFGPEKNAIMDAFTGGRVTVVVYGLGKMGLPLTAVFAERDARIFSGKE